MASYDGSDGSQNFNRRFIWVDLVMGNVKTSYDISIVNSNLSPCFQEKSYFFQRESDVWPGRWCTIGNYSPIKAMSELKCYIVKRPPVFNLDFESTKIRPIIPNISPIHHSTDLDDGMSSEGMTEEYSFMKGMQSFDVCYF